MPTLYLPKVIFAGRRLRVAWYLRSTGQEPDVWSMLTAAVLRRGGTVVRGTVLAWCNN